MGGGRVVTVTLVQLQPRLVCPEWKNLPVFLCSSHYLHYFWAVSKNRFFFFFETESVSPGKATCVSLSLEARGVVGMFGVQQPSFQVCRSGPTWASEAPALQALSCLPKQVVRTHLSRQGELSAFPQAERLCQMLPAWLCLVKVWCSSGFQGGLRQGGPEPW